MELILTPAHASCRPRAAGAQDAAEKSKNRAAQVVKQKFMVLFGWSQLVSAERSSPVSAGCTESHGF